MSASLAGAPGLSQTAIAAARSDEASRNHPCGQIRMTSRNGCHLLRYSRRLFCGPAVIHPTVGRNAMLRSIMTLVTFALLVVFMWYDTQN